MTDVDVAPTRADGAPDDIVGDIVGDIGDRIGDLRAHLAHAHPLRAEWLAELAPAELASVHRRLHGRHVVPDPELVDTHLVEQRTDPAEPAVTTLPLADATRADDPLVWLPMRIADRVHSADGPTHTDRGGCRACADVIEATILALLELDETPQRQLAALVATHVSLLEGVADIRSALTDLLPAHVDVDEGRGGAGPVGPDEDDGPSITTGQVAAVLAVLDRVLERER